MCVWERERLNVVGSWAEVQREHVPLSHGTGWNMTELSLATRTKKKGGGAVQMWGQAYAVLLLPALLATLATTTRLLQRIWACWTQIESIALTPYVKWPHMLFYVKQLYLNGGLMQLQLWHLIYQHANGNSHCMSMCSLPKHSNINVMDLDIYLIISSHLHSK